MKRLNFLAFACDGAWESDSMSHMEMLESRVLLSSSPAGYSGFTVTGNKVYDSAGAEFIIKGFNHTMYWGNQTQNVAAIGSFDQTGANAVRLVFTNDPTHTWSSSETWAKRKAAIDAVIAEGMVPILEFHNATGVEDASALSAIVDTWVADAANLQPYEGKIILNIANEWGPHHTNKTFGSTSAKDYWANAYTNAIQRIRNAGIDSLLMVDSGMWAQDARFIRDKGQQVLNSDPHKNVLFSLHMYKQWYNPGTTSTNYNEDWARFDVQQQLSYIKNTLNLPIFIGEFTWEQAGDVQANDGSGNTYTTRKIMEVAHNLGVGWTAWSWNENADTRLDMLVDGKWLYNSADLTAFGNLIINDSAYGLKATAKKAAGFGGSNGGGSGGGTGGGTAPTGTGSITRDIWNNVNGSSVKSIPLTKAPSATSTLTRFEAPTNIANNYGQRIRGYITAPTTGSYTFWIAGDDNVELYLSTDANPANKTRIAHHAGWTHNKQWNKYSTQKSAAKTLTAGTRYYIEALMKEANGGDNLAVAWAKPGQPNTSPSEVIPGSALSPMTNAGSGGTGGTGGTGGSPGGATNLLANGQFTNGTTGWNTYHNTQQGAQATVTTASTQGMTGHTLRASINNGGKAISAIQVSQAVTLAAGQTYRVTFKAKADANRSLRLDTKQNSGNYTNYAGKTFNLTRSVKTFSLDFTPNQAGSLVQFGLGQSAADVWLDDITLTRV